MCGHGSSSDHRHRSALSAIDSNSASKSSKNARIRAASPEGHTAENDIQTSGCPGEDEPGSC